MIGRLLHSRLSKFTPGVGFGISGTGISRTGAVSVTKYRITKPLMDDVSYDDFLIRLPDRDELASHVKSLPVFVRFLKVITDQEGRKDDFHKFVLRCKDGLKVERDVYLTADELLSSLWKYGYSDNERNALLFTFGKDYNFHYPELAVMLNISEEDAYKYCMRTRMEASHIGALDATKTARKGLIRDHWLLYAGGWFVFKNFPFHSYLFFMKTWGFALWFATCWSLFGSSATKSWHRAEDMLLQKVSTEKLAGEDAIVDAMKRFVNDKRCVDFTKAFKEETEEQVREYQLACIADHKAALAEKMTAQLQNIVRAESAANSKVQDVLIKDTMVIVKQKLTSDSQFRTSVLSSAIEALGGSGKTQSMDPIGGMVSENLKKVEKVSDWSKVEPNSNGDVTQRLSALLAASNAEFKNAFYVAKDDLAAARRLGAKCFDSGMKKYILSKLSAEELGQLDSLCKKAFDKLGLHYIGDPQLAALTGESGHATLGEKDKSYVEASTAAVASESSELRDSRILYFLRAL